MVNFNDLVTDTENSSYTPSLATAGGAQKVGFDLSANSQYIPNFSVGHIEHEGFSWSFQETPSGSVIMLGLDENYEYGIYYEVKNPVYEIIDGEKVYQRGVVAEVGVVHNATSITDAAGVTIGVTGSVSKLGLTVEGGTTGTTTTLSYGTSGIGPGQIVITKAWVHTIAS